MTRKQALVEAAELLASLQCLKARRDYRKYQNDLNQIARALMDAAQRYKETQPSTTFGDGFAFPTLLF
jgi:hypothetical protein